MTSSDEEPIRLSHPAAVTTVAFYLPQFRPTAYNDAWWGPGFTEWTQVVSGRPLFRGHQQPKVPGELGFYDLRIPEVRVSQANLALAHGVDAFCYWHYWFAGRRLLHEAVDEMQASGEPRMKFCLGWANEDWTAAWAGQPEKILMPQRYPGEADDRAHFSCVEAAFHDPRYLRIDNRPVFYLYRPLAHPYLRVFMDRWHACAQRSGLPGVFFVAETDAASLAACGAEDRMALGSIDALAGLDWLRAFRTGDRIRRPRRGPLRAPYAKVAADFPFTVAGAGRSYPCVLTGWDDTPRRARQGVVLTGRTPELFAAQVRTALAWAALQPDPMLMFVKSWNEWSEGNYLEPDRMTGRVYLEAFASAFRAAVAEIGPGAR